MSVIVPPDEFQKGDELAAAGDRAALEYAWWANNWLFAQATQSNADPESRAALTFALTVLHSHHKRYLSQGQIADRMRIGRAFPRSAYNDLQEELHYEFTFSQLRAAYIRDDYDRTVELLLWAAENDASPDQIYAKKMGGVVETDDEKAWRHLFEWAQKYTLRCPDRQNGKRLNLARMVIKQDLKEKARKKMEAQNGKI